MHDKKHPESSTGRQPRAGNGATKRVAKPCFRFAHPDLGDGALQWVPDDFPAVFGAKHLTLVDQVIMRLINARNDLDDPGRAPEAQALIARVIQTLHAFDPDSKLARYELIVSALDHSSHVTTSPWFGSDGKVTYNPLTLGQRVALAEQTIRSVLPSAKLPAGVLRRAVELWPNGKQREARSRAVRELATALDCNASSLMTQLRQARRRMQNRRATRRRK